MDKLASETSPVRAELNQRAGSRARDRQDMLSASSEAQGHQKNYPMAMPIAISAFNAVGFLKLMERMQLPSAANWQPLGLPRALQQQPATEVFKAAPLLRVPRLALILSQHRDFLKTDGQLAPALA